MIFCRLEMALGGLAHVHLHRSRRNLGFGRANNLLLHRSVTPQGYTVVANNDIVSTEGAIGAIIAQMRAADRMGLVDSFRRTLEITELEARVAALEGR
jgi:GT2 family glycosyltransferase